MCAPFIDYKCYILENWLCLYVDYSSSDESAAHHRGDVYTWNRRLSLRSTCWFKRCWPYLRQNGFDRIFAILGVIFLKYHRMRATTLYTSGICCACVEFSRDKVPNLCASSTSRNFCIATLSIFLSLKLLLFSPWKMTSKFYYPFFLPIFKSRECTHRARNGWSKDLQLNASYHRKSIKNRQFAPVCLTYLNTVLSDVLDRDESRWEERTLQINLIETEILSRRYALIASGRLVESGR